MHTHRRYPGIRAFSLVEVMIVLVIVGILATIGIPSYQNFIEDSRARMCETNLLALKSAFDIYMVEHNVVPGDLGQIPSEDIEKALARARRGAGWQEKLVRFIDEQRERTYAFASLIEELGKGNLRMLFCPSDTRRNDAAVARDLVSYGINADLAAVSKDAFDDFSVATPVIADCENSNFTSNSTMTQRHKYSQGFKGYQYANYVTKGGWVQSNDPSIEDPAILTNVTNVVAASDAYKAATSESPDSPQARNFYNDFMRMLKELQQQCRHRHHYHHR